MSLAERENIPAEIKEGRKQPRNETLDSRLLGTLLPSTPQSLEVRAAVLLPLNSAPPHKALPSTRLPLGSSSSYQWRTEQ